MFVTTTMKLRVYGLLLLLLIGIMTVIEAQELRTKEADSIKLNYCHSRIHVTPLSSNLGALANPVTFVWTGLLMDFVLQRVQLCKEAQLEAQILIPVAQGKSLPLLDIR